MSTVNNRQIFIDTETTGFNMLGVFYEGHRIIEIGAVEVINRRLTGINFHIYLQPGRIIDPKAFAIHGISDEFLIDKPKFSDIASEFLEYIRGAELIIHNATFDIGFIDYEFSLMNFSIGKIETLCQITDSLELARKMFPGKRNSLDALCKRYKIDNSKRIFHGALLDAEILAEVFLAMTGGQKLLAFYTDKNDENNCCGHTKSISDLQHNFISDLTIIPPSSTEINEHEKRLDLMENNGSICLWRK